MGNFVNNFMLKLPKNDSNFFWTKHSIDKMKQYFLSEQRIKRVLRNPDRTEEGIAPGTIAMMQRAGSKKRPYEIWTMFAIEKSKRKEKSNVSRKIIISCWRYPGLSPKGNEIPIPDEIREEVMQEIQRIKNNERHH